MSCLNPFTLKDPEGVSVPCGKCPPCLKRRASGWAFRLSVEERQCISSYFVTLTYDNENLRRTPRGYGTLNIKDVQLFFKKLRRLHAKRPIHRGEKIKYYVAGEYGSRGSRPHYHAIIFNAHYLDIEQAWERGFVHIGTATGASVGYTLKYMCKQGRIPMHKNDDRVPERSLMSKALGAGYLTPQMKKWHHAKLGERVYCNDGGVKIAMPRYYRGKLYDEEQMAIIQVAMNERRMRKLEEEYDILAGGKGVEEYQRVVKARSDAQYKKMYTNAKKDRKI